MRARNRIFALLGVLPLLAACGSAPRAKAKLDRSVELSRRVATIYVHPLTNTTGNEEAGRIVEAAIRHRLEFAGFRLVEGELSAGALLSGDETPPPADLSLRPTLTLATTGTDKIDWFPYIFHPIGWVAMAGDALNRNNVVAVQLDALLEEGATRTPLAARGYIEQKRLDFLPGVGAVANEIATRLAAEIKKASDRNR